MPFGLVTVRDLEKGIAEIPVFALYGSVSLHIVSGDGDVIDPVAVCKNFEGFEERCAVVGDDMTDCAPSAKDVLENEVSESFRVFGSKHASFGVLRNGTSGMYHITKSTRLRHKQCVYIRLREKRGGHCDFRRYVNLLGLSGLADVARVYKPLDIQLEVRPPKALNELSAGREKERVSDGLVRLRNERETTRMEITKS